MRIVCMPLFSLLCPACFAHSATLSIVHCGHCHTVYYLHCHNVYLLHCHTVYYPHCHTIYYLHWCCYMQERQAHTVRCMQAQHFQPEPSFYIFCVVSPGSVQTVVRFASNPCTRHGGTDACLSVRDSAWSSIPQGHIGTI